MLHIKSMHRISGAVRLETIIRKWADHITLPITVARDRRTDRPTKERALAQGEVETTEQSYEDFYRHPGHFFDDPWATLHWRAEGTLEYSASCSSRG